VKKRIKNVLNYKKPKSFLVIAGIAIISAIGAGLLCNPKSTGHKYKIDEAKVVRMTMQTYPDGDMERLDDSICKRIINEINNSKWKDLDQEDWPDEKSIAYSITITMRRDESIDNKEYILWVYRNKDKNLSGQEHEYALVLTFDDLSGKILCWSLPQSLYYNLRDILAAEYMQ